MKKILISNFFKPILLVSFSLMLLQFSIGISQANPTLHTPTSESLSELGKFIEEFSKEKHIPGTAVAVASKGELLYFHAYGMANVELSVPVSKESVFEIGSISKQFVSAAAMLLVEE
jgi:CubicO group peptidase (beta-lactamase class C family)